MFYDFLMDILIRYVLQHEYDAWHTGRGRPCSGESLKEVTTICALSTDICIKDI